jgi:hypothetical protein
MTLQTAQVSRCSPVRFLETYHCRLAFGHLPEKSEEVSATTSSVFVWINVTISRRKVISACSGLSIRTGRSPRFAGPNCAGRAARIEVSRVDSSCRRCEALPNFSTRPPKDRRTHTLWLCHHRLCSSALEKMRLLLL